MKTTDGCGWAATNNWFPVWFYFSYWDPNWNMSARMNRGDPTTVIQEAIDSGSFYKFISDLKPRDEFYNQLKAVLAKYHGIKKEGGWQPIPSGTYP